MKKTYIAPENTVVNIKLETMIAQSDPTPAALNKSVTIDNVNNIGSREVIETPDAWEEWWFEVKNEEWRVKNDGYILTSEILPNTIKAEWRWSLRFLFALFYWLVFENLLED